MKTRKVIHPSNLPMRPPFLFTGLAYILMDYYEAPDWVFGSVGLFLVLLWIIWVIDVINREHIDVLNKEKSDD